MQGLLHLIECERRGDVVNRVLLSHVLRMLTSLGIYEEAFQGGFLEASTAFYAAEGVRMMQSTDTAEYLLHCEVRGTERWERFAGCRIGTGRMCRCRICIPTKLHWMWGGDEEIGEFPITRKSNRKIGSRMEFKGCVLHCNPRHDGPSEKTC